MLKKSLMALAFVGAAASVQAATFTGPVDAGTVDTFVGEIDKDGLAALCGPGNSPSNELCWINTLVDPDTVYGLKSGNQSVVSALDPEGVVGFLLSSPTEYFLIKNANNYALFSNNADLNWAVISLGDLSLSGWNIVGGGTISHVATIGDVPQVPLPGTLGLLGLGLVGLGAMRRRMA